MTWKSTEISLITTSAKFRIDFQCIDESNTIIIICKTLHASRLVANFMKDYKSLMQHTYFLLQESYYFTFWGILMSALFSISIFTTAVCPLEEAQKSDVLPFWEVILAKIFCIIQHPFCHTLSKAFMWALVFTNRPTISTWPLADALWRAVSPVYGKIGRVQRNNFQSIMDAVLPSQYGS